MLNSPGWRDVGTRYFVLGLVLGGLAIGSVVLVAAWVLPPLPDPLVYSIVVAGVGYATAHALGWVTSLPQRHRQVERSVHRRGGIVGSFQFGFEMGTGVRTYTPTALPHVCALSLILVAEPGTGVVAGGAFAMGRAVVLLGPRVKASWELHQVSYGKGFAQAVVVLGVMVVAIGVWRS